MLQEGIIRIEKIPDAGLHLVETLSQAYIQDIFSGVAHTTVDGVVQVDLQINKQGKQIIIQGQVEVPILTTCARCLSSFSFVLKSKIQTTLFPKKTSSSKDSVTTETGSKKKSNKKFQAHNDVQSFLEQDESDEQMPENDLGAGEYDGQIIAYGEIIQEQLLLDLPMAKLCKEDCLGICPQCGVDRNETMCQCEVRTHQIIWDKLKLVKPIDG